MRIIRYLDGGEASEADMADAGSAACTVPMFTKSHPISDHKEATDMHAHVCCFGKRAKRERYVRKLKTVPVRTPFPARLMVAVKIREA